MTGRIVLVFLRLLAVGATDFKKAHVSVVSNRSGMKFGSIVLHVKTHRLTKSDFRHDAMNVRPPLAAAASAGCR